MRASDPIFEMGLTPAATSRRTASGSSRSPRSPPTSFDHEAKVDTQVVCVDKKRQWSKWTNVWHSSAIRSTLYMLGRDGR